MLPSHSHTAWPWSCYFATVMLFCHYCTALLVMLCAITMLLGHCQCCLTLSRYFANVILLCHCDIFSTVRLYVSHCHARVQLMLLSLSYCPASHAASKSRATLPLWSCLQLSLNVSTVELPCCFHATFLLWYCFITVMLHCYCHAAWHYHAVLPLMLLLGHSRCCLTPVITPCQSCWEPVSRVSIVLLLVNRCITFLLSCYIASSGSIPLHYCPAACHCHAALPERSLSSLMLLCHTLSHCSTLSGYLAAYSIYRDLFWSDSSFIQFIC